MLIRRVISALYIRVLSASNLSHMRQGHEWKMSLAIKHRKANIIQRLESGHQLLACKSNSHPCNTCFCNSVLKCHLKYFNDTFDLNLSLKLQEGDVKGCQDPRCTAPKKEQVKQVTSYTCWMVVKGERPRGGLCVNTVMMGCFLWGWGVGGGGCSSATVCPLFLASFCLTGSVGLFC